MNGLTSSLVLALIPVIVPILIAGLKTFIPKIPKPVLPIVAPILGVLVDFGLSWATGVAGANPVVAATLGTAGTGVREIVDQVRKAAGIIPSSPEGRIGLP